MTRRLLYTAITRAKQKVIVYNQGDSLSDAVKDKAERTRFTMLEHRLTAAAR
jgi:ATP-dependent exoDNAse (exonuclease V) alpha subunit